ncbi:MAG: DUF4347 domain-containing protein, partial [Gammaproteobacteria bacterium]|nr:DUF4347 domain-containing protein [Gammaproteobacteria bacterium]
MGSANKNRNRSNRSKPVIEALEPRLLYSADAFGAAVDTHDGSDPLQATLDESGEQAFAADPQQYDAATTPLVEPRELDDAEYQTLLGQAPGLRSELIIIDPATPDYQTLVDGLLAQEDDSRQFEVVMLEANRDGVAQIGDILAGFRDLDAVHLISHADAGAIQLGDTLLTEQSLATASGEIAGWASSFSASGDLLIYGCDLASNEAGEMLVDALAALTGADVAASDDITGHQNLGGDWELEYQQGEIETDVVLNVETQQAWQGTLEAVTGTNFGFEEPNTFKQTNWENVSGWSSDSVATDSGVENGSDYGSWRGYLYNVDPSVWQLTSQTISAGETYELTVASQYSAAAGELTMRLYYDDGGSRTTITSLTTDLTWSWTDYSITFNADDNPAAIGHQIGIEFENTAGVESWIGLDDVRLSVTSATPTDLTAMATTDGGLSINADGGNDAYVQTDSSPFSGQSEVTIEVQFSIDSPATDMTTLLSYATGSNQDELFLGVDSSGEIFFRTSANGSAGYGSITKAPQLFDGEQHSVAVTWENTGGILKFYVDGEELGLGRNDYQKTSTIDAGGTLVFGQHQGIGGASFDSDDTFEGKLYDVRIFDEVRSEAEIAASYRTTLPYDEPGLIANWDFDNLSADGVVTDRFSGNNLTLQHVSGFTASTPTLTLSVDENALDGTEIGTLVGTDAQREALIAALLAADPDMSYSAETGKFYKLVAGSYDWTTARSNAEAAVLNTVSGQLVTIRSAAENEIVQTIAATAGGSLWLGATDATVEGEWRWLEDGADSDLFWQGAVDGASSAGAYENWYSATQPNNLGGNEDAARMDSASGDWYDAPVGFSGHSFIVEWSADEVLDVTQALTYSIQSQTVNGAFAIDADSGTISVADGSLLDYEAQASHTLTVRVTDADGNFYDEAFTIALNDIAELNSAPSDLSSGIELNTDGGNDAYLYTTNGGTILGGLSQVTVEMLFSSDGLTDRDTLFSYASAGNSNEFIVWINDAQTLEARVNDSVVSLGINAADLADGETHALALSWDNTLGSWAFYLDGDLQLSGTGLKTGYTLEAGGTLVFGQEQDGINSAFDSTQAFSGTLYDVRIWNEVRSVEEIALNYQQKIDSNDLPTGLVANWQMDGFNGSSEVVDIVSGNNLSIGHAGGAGFSASTPLGDLHVAEGVANGTSVGFVVPTDPDLHNDLVSDGLFLDATPATTQYGVTGNFGGWSVTSGSIDLFATTDYETPLGGRAVNLDGGSPGSITQTITTQVDRQYQVIFRLAGDFSGGESVKDLRVSASGTSEDFSIDQTSGWSWGDVGTFEERSFTFTADGSSTDLSFASLEGATSQYGPYIADIQVIEIPQAVSAILNSDSTLTYDAATGKFYKVVATATDIASAKSNAAGMLVNDVAGQLVNIRSEYENQLVWELIQGQGSEFYIGATDATSEGVWNWTEQGAEADNFWNGDSSGSAAGGAYANFFAGEPNDWNTGEDYAAMLESNGQWLDLSGTADRGYVIEWDAAEVLSNFTFSLIDDVGGRFAIDSNSGEITVANGSLLDYETATSHDVTVEVTDAAGNSYSEAMTITIDPVNDNDPVAVNESITVAEGGTITTLDGGAASVLTNDSDADLPNDSLTVAVDTDVTHGTLTLNADGTFSYTHDGTENFSDSFTYIISDADGGLTDSGTVTITITPDNDAPVLASPGGTYPYSENAGAVVLGGSATLSDVDSTDFDGGQLVYQISNNGLSEDRLDIRHQGTAAGQIGISGTNISYGGTLIGTYTGAVTGSTQLVVSFNASASAAAVEATLKNVTYENTSDNPTASTRTLQVYATDGDGGTSNTLTGYVAVSAVNDDPVNLGSLPSDILVQQDIASPIDLSAIDIGDVDANGGDLSIKLISSIDGVMTAAAGSGITISGNGSSSVTLTGTLTDLNSYLNNTTNIRYVHGIPGTYGASADSIEVKLNDLGNTGSGGGSDITIGSINIDINATPVVVGESYNAFEGQPYTAALAVDDLLLNDSDPYGGTISVNTTPVLGPSNGQVILNADGSFVYTPDAGFNGTDSFIYQVDDGNGGTAQATATITVYPRDIRILFSTNTDIANSKVPGLDSWESGEVLAIADPNLTFEPAGSDGSILNFMNLESFAADTEMMINGLHFVSNSVTVGSANAVTLQHGDVLFTAADNEVMTSTNSLAVDAGDVIIFRPDTAGDYSAGTFIHLLEQPGAALTTGITLVENDITIGDVTLDRGTFLFTQDDGGSDIYHFTADDAGVGTTGTVSTLIDGSEIGMSGESFAGLMLVTDDLNLPGTVVPAGSIVTTLTGKITGLGSNNLALNGDEMFYLTVSTTTMGSGTTDVSATLLFDAGEIGLNNENKDVRAFTLIENVLPPNEDPVLSASLTSFNYTEGDPATFIDPAATLTDADSINFNDGLLRVDLAATGTLNDRLAINNEGSGAGQIGVSGTDVTYGGVVIGTWSGGVDGLTPLTIQLNSSSDAVSVQALIRNITYENVSSDPSETQRQVRISVTDGDGGNSETMQVAIVVDGANSAPVLSGANDLDPINEDFVSNAGTLVADLVSGRISDADPMSITGIAVVGVDNANGSWEFSTDGGSNWSSLGSPSSTAVRLLAGDASTYVRFVPNLNWNGTVANGITFHAWDQTSGANGDVIDMTAADTIRDEFNSVSYSANDGTGVWTSAWTEVNDDGSAATGDIRIENNKLHISNQDGGSTEYVYRSADLSDAISATLTLDFDAYGGGSIDTVTTGVSIDGGATWIALREGKILGSSSGTRSMVIDDFVPLTDNMLFRFGVIAGMDAPGEYINFDNIDITWTGGGSGGSSSISTATASSGITVNPVDDLASVTGDTSGSGNESTVISGDLNATDVEGLGANPFSIFADGSNGSASIDAATGAWSYTPTDPDWFGTDSFTVRVTDAEGGTTDQIVSITV